MKVVLVTVTVLIALVHFENREVLAQGEDFTSIAVSYVLTSAVDPLYGVELESTVPALDQALDYINSNNNLNYTNSSLLRGLTQRNTTILEVCN